MKPEVAFQRSECELQDISRESTHCSIAHKLKTKEFSLYDSICDDLYSIKIEVNLYVTYMFHNIYPSCPPVDEECREGVNGEETVACDDETQCFPPDNRCNIEADCHDRSDEAYCGGVWNTSKYYSLMLTFTGFLSTTWVVFREIRLSNALVEK